MRDVDILFDEAMHPNGILSRTSLWILLSCQIIFADTAQLAFPGAEGYGRFAKGGRGGDVYHVTQLGDQGEGSFRAGLENTDRPRTIVFDVSGTIQLEKPLVVKDIDGLTIAGQTAPGDGITLRDQTFQIKDSSNIIVRFIRVRLGDESKTSADTINISRAEHVILDHVTATWGVDGTMDTEHLSNFTLQWSLFGEALHESTHHKGGHAMLMSLRKTSGKVSLHHNLLFSSRNRHPTLGGDPNGQALFDYRNNVIYNWEGSMNLGIGRFNIINNYYRPGPNTNVKEDRFPIRPKVKVDESTFGYLSGTVFEWNDVWSKDNRLAMQWGVRDEGYPGNVPKDSSCLSNQPVAQTDRPTTQPAKEAYAQVLEKAGASLVRDAADQRVIQGVLDRTHRRIDSQKDVGGWPKLQSKLAPADKDRDGMPDQWESDHNLDPMDAEDRNGDRNSDGYTNLEEYLNALIESSDPS
ncbi:MAG: pectate lyase [Verrucomicrobiaceae bacterium]|nr:pectate lyase [Verrucomicrobiaceae bacterium]